MQTCGICPTKRRPEAYKMLYNDHVFEPRSGAHERKESCMRLKDRSWGISSRPPSLTYQHHICHTPATPYDKHALSCSLFGIRIKANPGPGINMATTAPLIPATAPAGHALASDSIGELPETTPRLLESPMVWAGGKFADERTFIFPLSSEDVCELESALIKFKGRVSLGFWGDC